jgi:serine/threonine protein kinase
MSSAVSLLACIAKALCKHGGNAVGFGVAGTLLVEVAETLAEQVWEAWGKRQDEGRRQAEIEQLVRATAGEIRLQIDDALKQVANDQSAESRQTIAAYLMQVPAAARSSFRRPDDPTGTTIPPALVARKPSDLLALLPTKLPHFKPGDRPLAGADWELVELLGVGGFGEVWKARNPVFDGVPAVALKFCLDASARDRLLRHEAAILNRVMREGHHPGIVQLQQTFLRADPPCLAYEYIEGGDLGTLIQCWHVSGQGPTPRQAAKIVAELAAITGFAHRLTPPIVHRDLKPANILVPSSPRGAARFKVADFGIGGVAASATAGQSVEGLDPKLLTTSAVRGSCTPLYASPQQLRGQPPDPRDDVYALGVIWFQILVGDLARGRPGGSRWRQPLLAGGVSQPLLDLLESCFEDDVDARPRDGAELAAQITSQLTATPARAPAVPKGERREGDSSEVPRSQVGPSRGRSSALTPSDPWCHFQGHSGAIVSLAISPDGCTALSGSRDETMRWWDLGTANIEQASAEPSGRRAEGRQRRCFAGHRGAVYGVAFSPDGQRAISADAGHLLRVWRLDDGEMLCRLDGHTAAVHDVVFLPDGRHAVSASGDGTLRVWDVARGTQVRTSRGQSKAVFCLALAGDGEHAVYGGEDQAVRVWHVARGRETCCLTGHAGSVLGVALSADARLALSGGMDQSARLWDLKRRREIMRFEGHRGSVLGVALSRDGRLALTGGMDRTVRLWDTATGAQLVCFEGHAGRVIRVAFSPNGKCALSGSDDKMLIRWGIAKAEARTAA